MGTWSSVRRVSSRNQRVDEGSAAVVPSPPELLNSPNIVELERGELLHRVHDRAFAGDDFNPCRGGPTRFAPIRDQEGRCIPSLHAGTTLESAIYETIFHDVPPSANRKTVPRGMVESCSHSTLLMRRSLRLASLRAPDLMRWGVRRDVLIGSLPAQYARTALWAKAIHDQFGDVHGLIWTSNLCDPEGALLLFGDRVSATDLLVAGVRAGTDGSFLGDVRTAGRRGAIC